MSIDTRKRKLSDEQKAALKELRALKGETRAAVLKEHLVATRKGKKAVAGALADGPATIPQLAATTGLPADRVLWIVAGMRKYGELAEAELDGDYPRYELTPNS